MQENCEFSLLLCNNIDNEVNRTILNIEYEYEITQDFKDNKVNRILKFSFLRGSNPRPYDYYIQKEYKSRMLYQLS